VLQFLFATAKTGCITLSEGLREGRICLESGRVVHAELGELEGLAAFRRMCFSQQGWFRFDPGEPAPRRTLRADGIALLLESARLKDLEDRDEIAVPVKKARTPSRELFIVARSDDPSRASPIGPAGIALLIGILLLVAYGLFP
jgi:hypothetical protein